MRIQALPLKVSPPRLCYRHLEYAGYRRLKQNRCLGVKEMRRLTIGFVDSQSRLTIDLHSAT